MGSSRLAIAILESEGPEGNIQHLPRKLSDRYLAFIPLVGFRIREVWGGLRELTLSGSLLRKMFGRLVD